MEISIINPMAVKTLPENGTFRLCRKLPRTISDAAQMVPIMDALIHFSLNAGLIINN
jgi:hypothetical protein